MTKRTEVDIVICVLNNAVNCFCDCEIPLHCILCSLGSILLNLEAAQFVNEIVQESSDGVVF